MPVVQDQRQISVSGPLEQDVLVFYSMTGNEELGRLFKYELDLLSTDANINLDDVLGKPLTVQLAMADGKHRYFNGYASNFRYMGVQQDYHLYKATLRPWLWFLTRSADCRIFQNKTVPDIIKEIFRDFGYSEFEDQLSENYEPWEYCVQYRESAFNFVSRLMEQEGIYYYFKQQQDTHTLVLADSISAHSRIDNSEQIPYYPPQQHERREGEYLDHWFVSKGIEPQRYTLSDFDFTKPKSSLEVRESIEDGYADFEIFDYPGEYSQVEVGQAVARSRAEQLETHYERINAKGNVRPLSVGSLFELTNFPRGDQNKEYLTLSARYYLHSDHYRSAKEAPDLPDYRIVLTAMDSIHSFRAARTTPQPTVKGPQTAIVVGPEGEKVWVDQYGRVKVQFHWDRYGKKDQNSSCWIRVSQNWAGKNWGGMHIPHIGQEVIVEFLEGDPDRPLITGRVYNADNMPPIPLPENKLKSIIRDDYGNEIVFNGTPGEEHIRLFSPNHNSLFEVGKSIGGVSASDHWEWSIGNKAECGLGTKSDAYLGSAFEIFAGAKTGIDIGMLYEAKIGAQVGVELGPKVEWSWSPQIRDSEEQIVHNADKDVIINGDQNVCIVGGYNEEPLGREDKNSILNMDAKKILLSIGDQQRPKNLKLPPAEIKRLEKLYKYMILSAAAVIPTTLHAAQAGLNELFHHAYKGDDAAIGTMTGLLEASQIVASAIQISLALGYVKLRELSQNYDTVKHQSTDAKIELSKDGTINIHSKEKEIVIDTGGQGKGVHIRLDHDAEKIAVNGKIIQLSAKDLVDVSADQFKFSGSSFNVNSEFKHRNITIYK